jgi:cell division septation protein DedD
MKLFGVPILKPAIAKIDKESMSWNLSWQPDGRCNSFTRETILLFAPSTSGVYGIFNFDCQIFIGESANIREALLRHQNETDFQSQHLKPTGFTFEPCAAELRKTKADELITRFRPVLQTGATLSEAWSLSNGPMLSETDQGGWKLADHQEFHAHEREESPTVRRSFQLKRTPAVALATILVASAAVIFFLGLPADYAIHKRADGANPTSTEKVDLRPQNMPSIDAPSELANQKAEPTPAKPDVHASAPTPNTMIPLATKSPGAERAAVQVNKGPIAHPAEGANLNKKWSVQISAAPAKDVADTLVQKLKANGYDGYLVEATVNGQIYYRVCVGHFDAREKAEAVRQSLARQEGHQDAYLTGD